MNNSKTIAYIVMEGENNEGLNEGLLNYDEPFRVFLTKEAAEKSTERKPKDSISYFEIIRIILP